MNVCYNFKGRSAQPWIKYRLSNSKKNIEEKKREKNSLLVRAGVRYKSLIPLTVSILLDHFEELKKIKLIERTN